MDDYSIDTLREAKGQLLARLENLLFRPLYTGLNGIFAEAATRAASADQALSEFQNRLAEVPNWNQTRIDAETARIVTLSKCEWLDDLITSVFVSQCKVYTSIKITQQPHKFVLTLPKTSHFIHQVYSECARRLWPYVYLFDKSFSDIKRQKNLRHIEEYIRAAIDETVGSMLPLREIVHEYTKIVDDTGNATLVGGGPGTKPVIGSKDLVDTPIVPTAATPTAVVPLPTAAPAPAPASDPAPESEIGQDPPLMEELMPIIDIDAPDSKLPPIKLRPEEEPTKEKPVVPEIKKPEENAPVKQQPAVEENAPSAKPLDPPVPQPLQEPVLEIEDQIVEITKGSDNKPVSAPTTASTPIPEVTPAVAPADTISVPAPSITAPPPALDDDAVELETEPLDLSTVTELEL